MCGEPMVIGVGRIGAKEEEALDSVVITRLFVLPLRVKDSQTATCRKHRFGTLSDENPGGEIMVCFLLIPMYEGWRLIPTLLGRFPALGIQPKTDLPRISALE